MSKHVKLVLLNIQFCDDVGKALFKIRMTTQTTVIIQLVKATKARDETTGGEGAMVNMD